MNILFTILSLIPYVLYLYLGVKEEIVASKKIKTLIRLDLLILIAIFIYFARYHNPLVSKMLFASICLYLYVNKLYEPSLKNKKLNKKDYLKVLFIYILGSLCFLPYIIFRHLTSSYYLLFLLILVLPFIMRLLKKVTSK